MSISTRQIPLRASVYCRVRPTAYAPRSPFRSSSPSVSPRRLSTAKDREYTSDENAHRLERKGFDQHEQVKQKQVRRPWLREGADKPPAEELGKPNAAPTQGKLLTTPTRLLKLVLPLPLRVEKDTENNEHSGSDYGRALSSNDRIQPLALLVHPQQPLSYVERLIQAELPPVVEDGKEKVPNIYFRAEDTGDGDEVRGKGDGKREGVHKGDSAAARRNVATYSGLGREGPERAQADKNWVRWSSSTEVGDFIRDAARGREFAIEVEGHDVAMRVAVPSFNDRTFYQRMRLRRKAREIDSLADIKQECDKLAHRGAHRLAKGGFVLLSGWWGVVYYLSFMTDWGWDLVEPMTYLVGLTTIMGGYLWFLFISRDLSYKAAMNLTVSRRRAALYEQKGFDPDRWQHLIQDANALRKEIRTVAMEYDVDWDEKKDVGEEVQEVLQEERAKAKKGKSSKDDEDDDIADEKPKKKDDEKKDS